jgi:hypothetical protein
MKILFIYALLLFVPLLATGQQEEDGGRLAYGNEALRAWLEQVDADVPYLLVDRAAREVRLMHGPAVLRTCVLRGETLGSRPDPRATVSARLRRYRVLNPWGKPQVGPFDWEERLVYSAPDNGALFFGNGLLLCADDVWQTEEAAVLVVSTEDLRALFNACSDGMPLVILPEDWQRDG